MSAADHRIPALASCFARGMGVEIVYSGCHFYFPSVMPRKRHGSRNAASNRKRPQGASHAPQSHGSTNDMNHTGITKLSGYISQCCFMIDNFDKKMNIIHIYIDNLSEKCYAVS